MNEELWHITFSIFNEFELGKREGFGNPDGALYFRAENKSYFIFIEAKSNETYNKSLKNLKIGNKGYNSTLKGQLELRYRFTKTLLSCDDFKENCIIAKSNKNFSKDIFYTSGKHKQPRHLTLSKNEVYPIAEKIRKCEEKDIYYLGITKEKTNPFINNKPQDVSSENLLWIPIWIPINSIKDID